MIPFVSKFRPDFKAPGCYTVLIGHRRLAAAKLAGLETVPCAVTEMDEKEQIAVMLLENMQRADLTPIEQAEGIQMMLDLGDSVAEVAKRTGYGETTIRRRVKLLEIDRDKLEAAFKNQATFEMIAAAQAIEDKDDREKVYTALGTVNYKYWMRSAEEHAKARANTPLADRALSEFAEKISEKEANTSKYERASNLGDAGLIDEWNLDKYKNDGKKYFYTSEPGMNNIRDFTLYTEAKKNAETKEKRNKKREKEQAEAVAELNGMSKIFYGLRKSFMADFIKRPIKKELEPVILKELLAAQAYVEALSTYSYGFNFTAKWLLDILQGEPHPDWEKLLEKYMKVIEESPYKFAAVCVYSLYRDGEARKYHMVPIDAKNRYPLPVKSKDDTLDRIYAALTALGYQMSDAEKEYQNGSHKAFGGGK